LTEDEVLLTLEKLGLEGRHFDHLELHSAIQEYMDLEIRLEIIRDDRCALVGRALRRSGIQAALVYVEEADYLTMQIPATAHAAEWKDIFYHELSHLLGHHPLPHIEKGQKSGEVSFWHPPQSLCRRRPPLNLEACRSDPGLRRGLIRWCEMEADSWTEHLRSISAYGRRIYLREEFILGDQK
ncbi:MAG: hypothetical protein WA982_00185, partial [Rubrobacteraceae bacterium]